MSILIKGVNLPSGKIGDGKVTGLLIDIPVAAKPTCEVFYETAEGGEESIGYEIEAVEVPTPHGRLIDEDKLTDEIVNMMPSLTTPDGTGQHDNEIYAVQETFVDIIWTIHAQPTVIKAEE